MGSSRNFMVSSLRFGSLIYFEFFFFFNMLLEDVLICMLLEDVLELDTASLTAVIKGLVLYSCNKSDLLATII